MRCILSFLLSAALLFSPMLPSSAAPVPDSDPAATEAVSVSAPSVILMEASTGQVVYEKDSRTSLRPASITKIMTMILIFDALGKGTISLTDEVTVSEYAASMGGSQVFLEPGEVQTVDTMLKCISVASANDACVAYMNTRHFFLFFIRISKFIMNGNRSIHIYFDFIYQFYNHPSIQSVNIYIILKRIYPI